MTIENLISPGFYFKVSLGFQVVSFQEIDGLEAETQFIEYRQNNSKEFSSIKMPGIAKYNIASLKKGVFVKDNNFWNWYNNFKMNIIKREIVTIKLINETGIPTMTWKLTNAWPTKISSFDVTSVGNQITVDLIELAYEGMVISSNV